MPNRECRERKVAIQIWAVRKMSRKFSTFNLELINLFWRRKRIANRRKIVFFFQAEDGIRDSSVTGVQTCALPISGGLGTPAAQPPAERAAGGEPGAAGPPVPGVHDGVAVGVDAGAGGAVELLGRVGAFDDPVLSGRAGGVPGLCVRCPVRVAGGVRAAGGCPSGAGLP